VNRLVLLTILGLCVWYYFPETRTMLADAAAPVLVPVARWSAEEEMGRIGRNVVEHERLTGELPLGAAWLGWLEYRYPAEDLGKDPWGSVYQLEARGDSVAVISFGPDRVRMTEDDFEILTGRGR
jgi:hypothetical protein